MKCKIDEKHGEIKLQPHTLEDLWHLTKLIEPGDVVAGHSERRFKTRDLTRPESGEKKKVFIELKVENIEFAEAVNKLRITGKIRSGTPQEFAPTGEHHTIDVELGDSILLKKELNVYHQKVLQEALKKSKTQETTIIVIDDEKALVSELTSNAGVRFIYEIRNEANKRDPKTFDELKKKFFSEVLKAVQTGKENAVIAGPGFARDNFKKYVSQKTPDALKKMSFEATSSAERSGVLELLKKGVLQRIFGKQKLSEEFELFEEFKKRIARGELACYGQNDVEKAIISGAVEKILVADELLRKNKKAQELVVQAEKLGATTVVFNSEDDAGKEFKHFALAALLRFKTYS
ncbi:mRNA surveillance protein pelota [Candidatus Micrarchaeota archaeon]|nr:mRNA surveillance protein pelota [Candidatus Micrarchaeota archaeon]